MAQHRPRAPQAPTQPGGWKLASEEAAVKPAEDFLKVIPAAARREKPLAATASTCLIDAPAHDIAEDVRHVAFAGFTRSPPSEGLGDQDLRQRILDKRRGLAKQVGDAHLDVGSFESDRAAQRRERSELNIEGRH